MDVSHDSQLCGGVKRIGRSSSVGRISVIHRFKLSVPLFRMLDCKARSTDHHGQTSTVYGSLTAGFLM